MQRADIPQREAHGQCRHAEQHVHADGDHLRLVLGFRHARYNVAETDRRDGYETVVRSGVHLPALPESEENGAEDDVAADDRQHYGERHADLVEILVVGGLVMVVCGTSAVFQIVVLDKDDRIVA